MTEFPITPTFDRVFVKKDDIEKIEGFFVPDTVKGRASTGTVVAVGPGRFSVEKGEWIPTQFAVGDRVFLKGFDGWRVDYEGHQVFVFSENEIIGKLVS